MCLRRSRIRASHLAHRPREARGETRRLWPFRGHPRAVVTMRHVMLPRLRLDLRRARTWLSCVSFALPVACSLGCDRKPTPAPAPVTAPPATSPNTLPDAGAPERSEPTAPDAGSTELGEVPPH